MGFHVSDRITKQFVSFTGGFGQDLFCIKVLFSFIARMFSCFSCKI